MANGFSGPIGSRAGALWRAVRDADAGAMPWGRARALGAVRIMLAVLRDCLRGQLSLRATSLVFTTLLSLVPLLAVAFSVLKGFGVHNQLEPALQNFLAPLGDQSAEITGRIIGFVDNIKVGVIGSLGIALLFYTILSLMHKIEQAFNYAWRLDEQRPMSARISDYLIVILVGPVLIFASLGVTATVVGSQAVAQLSAIGPLGRVLAMAADLVPYLMVVMAFTFIYVFMPNTKVRWGSALAGAVVAGILWQTSGWLFATFIANSPKYTAIYSAFAGLLLFMIWLYVSWLVLLVGAGIAFYHQHPECLRAGRRGGALSNRRRERLALFAIAAVGADFYAHGPGLGLTQLARRAGIPPDRLAPILEALAGAGLLAPNAAEPPAFLPARPLETMRLATVLDAIRDAGDDPGTGSAAEPGGPALDDLFDRLDAAGRDCLGAKTAKDLALAAVPGNQGEGE